MSRVAVCASVKPRREIRYESGHYGGWDRSSGIDLVLTRKGIEFHGFYDSFVGLEGAFVPWETIDRARAALAGANTLPHPSEFSLEKASSSEVSE